MSVIDSLAQQFAVNEKQGERARRLRRGQPIHMYVGRNGSGKSLAMVYDTIPDLEAGKQILSTVRLIDYTNPRDCDDDTCRDDRHGLPGHQAAHPLWVPFTDWPQLLEFRNGVVLMDEIVGVADSAESASIPSAVRKKFQELRRHEVQLRITGLNWIRAHKRIREAVRAVTRCESFLPVTAYDDAGEELVWRPRRLAVWRTYDAKSLPVDDHTDAAYDHADLLVKTRHWIPTSPATAVYDTLSGVTSVGEISDAGMCPYCYGTRQKLPCTCADYVERKAAAAPARRRASAEDGPKAAPLHVHGPERARF